MESGGRVGPPDHLMPYLSAGGAAGGFICGVAPLMPFVAGNVPCLIAHPLLCANLSGDRRPHLGSGTFLPLGEAYLHHPSSSAERSGLAGLQPGRGVNRVPTNMVTTAVDKTRIVEFLPSTLISDYFF